MSGGADTQGRLFKASLAGSVAQLEELIQEDELVLDRVFITYLDETPLHIAALRGHLDFVKALLHRKPELATELNSLRSSPLHLAAAAGYRDVVQELLQVNPRVCCVCDEDGRTPLHLAAMKERVEVIKELVGVKPDSIYERLSTGETILHLCVKYNRLESLKILIELQINNTEFVNSRDHRGNTILHLSVAFKQVETVKFLLGIKTVKENANVKNELGFTALDVLDHYPDRDLKSMKIQDLLLQSGATRAGQNYLQQPQSLTRDTESSSTTTQPESQTFFKIWKLISTFWGRYIAHELDWYKDIRGHLITAATLTATTAYQSGLSPPGGVWQEYDQNETQISIPGKAISAEMETDYYRYFLVFNSLSFVASVCVIIFALSGLPSRNKMSFSIMILYVFVALITMSLSYVFTIEVTTPHETVWTNTFALISFSFLPLVGSCLGFQFRLVSLFLVWLGKKCQRLCCMMQPQNQDLVNV